jgi:hypothetical protein
VRPYGASISPRHLRRPPSRRVPGAARRGHEGLAPGGRGKRLLSYAPSLPYRPSRGSPDAHFSASGFSPPPAPRRRSRPTAPASGHRLRPSARMSSSWRPARHWSEPGTVVLPHFV